MGKLENYRKLVTELLDRYGSQPSEDDVEIQVVRDTENDHYQIFHVGWLNNRRIYGCIFHIDIKNEKIWIQHDGTEIGTAVELAESGIPKEDIVLGFHAPYKRPFTGFGTG